MRVITPGETRDGKKVLSIEKYKETAKQFDQYAKIVSDKADEPHNPIEID